MGIMTRLTRLFKADIHGVMDQIENKELILKQCLREMETSLAEKQGRLNQLTAALDQARNEMSHLQREKEKLEQDLKTAILKEKDDIARLLIKKRIQIEQMTEAGMQRADAIEKECQVLGENIEAQKHQLAETRLRSESWLKAGESREWAKTLSRIPSQNAGNVISDEEIELELIKLKETVKGGA
jgi:phage shock protein A